ncbi:DUF5658 family protein [Fictibacillus barbaricus]|uniref:DUF5658 domain-containing protein n=1 Tax=Fictibacillus barbaricus TaxID=182136 RepID=A0ABU1U0Z9_9BACL|nr:DUF5658 family protein [Fictibacillus barbaricus]MDR7073148.1 hypothetical protein [Fictibacillus barbaricus]
MDQLFRVQRYLWICICLAIFNIADALFTHQFLVKGGAELNPVMRSIYAKDPVLFLLVKFFFSYLILAIGFIQVSKKVQVLLYIAFIIYSLIIVWHLYLNISLSAR